MTIQQGFDNFILSRRLADLSQKTIDNYEQFVIPFIEYIGANEDIKVITQENINAYISQLLDRPISKATRATYIRHIKIFLRWLQNKNTVCYEVKEIKVPKTPKRNVRIYSDDEILQIFSAIQCKCEWIEKRNKCIIALMYDSGLRQAEVCTLLKNRITDSYLTVRGKGDKERTVPIGVLTRKYLDEYLDLCPYESDRVFVDKSGGILTCNAVKLFVTKLANELPFELSSHKLRHNFATNYCIDQYTKNRLVDIYKLMYIMGHEEIETTRRYLHFAYEIIASRDSVSHLDSIMKVV